MRRFFVGLAITAMLGIIPCQARGNDRQISQAIVKNLQAEQKNGNLKGFDIDLEVDNGTVYLRGTVSSEEQEKIALDIARRIDGVRQVYNEIAIRPLDAASEAIETEEVSQSVTKVSKASREEPIASIEADDESPNRSKRTIAKASSSSKNDSQDESRAVATRIIERLKEEKSAGNLKGFTLDVEVDEGVAWLSGKVSTPEQQNLILDIVRHVPGVKQVVNGLSVSRASATPTDIAQQVITRIQEQKTSGALKDFSVDVEVDQGVVWLSGKASNEQQQQLILDAARYVPGVSKVVNDITIPGRTPSRPAAAKKGTDSGLKSAMYAQEEATQSAPQAPQPLPLQDAPIGSAVAARPLAQANPAAAGRPTVQYMWVPASQMPQQHVASPAVASGSQTPLAFAPARAANYTDGGVSKGGVDPSTGLGAGGAMVAPGAMGFSGAPVPMNPAVPGAGIGAARFDHPQLPQYAWPSYAPYPNYGAVTYPRQYSPMAWPYIGPFYPYPQVPLGWRKVELKWKDGWWQLDFKDRYHH